MTSLSYANPLSLNLFLVSNESNASMTRTLSLELCCLGFRSTPIAVFSPSWPCLSPLLHLHSLGFLSQSWPEARIHMASPSRSKTSASAPQTVSRRSAAASRARRVQPSNHVCRSTSLITLSPPDIIYISGSLSTLGYLFSVALSNRPSDEPSASTKNIVPPAPLPIDFRAGATLNISLAAEMCILVLDHLIGFLGVKEGMYELNTTVE